MTKKGRPEIWKFFLPWGPPWLSMACKPRQNLPSGSWVWKGWEPLL